MDDLSRRHVLQAGLAGAGTTAVVAAGCPVAGAAAGQRAGLPLTFGRMSPGLSPFAHHTVAVRSALLTLGAPGGPLDAQDDLFGPDADRSG